MTFLLIILVFFASCFIPAFGDYFVDNSSGYGRTFDGIGAISGGGATSRLLVNYPTERRNDILDLLFKPNFATSLHIFKVEIGGDGQSSDGTEASHMHEPWDENYLRGYEWWLMTEAKKRNPSIKLYGLPWSFPGWVGEYKNTPFSNANQTATYIIKWIQAAKSKYGLTLDYIGIWNEKVADLEYIKTLRSRLDDAKLTHIKIVASDNKWEIVDQLNSHPEYKKYIDIIGVHYPGTLSPKAAVKLQMPLWSSEDYSTRNNNTGAGCLARILNQNYVNGYMTSTIVWNLVTSYYNSLPWTLQSLMTANQPWSGNYVINNPVWITAHTTQFTEIGWKYLKHGSGVGHLDKGGSFVTIAEPHGKFLSVVIETVSHDHSICIRPPLPDYNVSNQTATFVLKGDYAKLTKLDVWYTKLTFSPALSEEATPVFDKRSPLTVTNGKFTLNLGVDEIWTLTSYPRGQKGSKPTPSESQDFPLPYKDNFDSYPAFSEPNNFAQQAGVFEIHPSTDKPSGNSLFQVLLNEPVRWCPFPRRRPINIIGNPKWKDIAVGISVRLPSVNGSSGVFVASHVSKGGCTVWSSPGVFFSVFISSKPPYKCSFKVTLLELRFPQITAGSCSFGRDEWFNIELTVVGNHMSGSLNHNIVFSTKVGSIPLPGFAALGAENFGVVEYDNFYLTHPPR